MRYFANTLLVTLVALATGQIPTVKAQIAQETWPARAITIVVSFAPGAVMDTATRILAQDVSSQLGQPVLIENRTGAGGVLAAASVARAPADGYTFLMTAIGPAVLRPILDKDVGYDLDADFSPIILAGASPNVLLVDPKSGLRTVTDLVAFAKSNPGKLSLAHSGPGTMGHLATVLFSQQAGVTATLLAYRGSAPMVTDIMNGQITAGFPAFGPESANVRILAVATEKRVQFLPDVPTMIESGFPNFVASTWNAIYAPGGLAPATQNRMNAAINTALRRPDIVKKLEVIGFSAIGGTPSDLANTAKSDRAKWAAIIRDNNITFDR